MLDNIDDLLGEWVVFVIFGRESLGVVTGYRDGRVLIDGGAGDLEVDKEKVLMVVDVPAYHTTASII